MIRKALFGDLKSIASLERLCFDYDVMTERLLGRLLQRPTAALFVSIPGTGQDPVQPDVAPVGGYGILLVRERTRVARVYGVAIHPACRNRGVGTELLLALEAEARRRSRPLIQAEVRVDNHPSLGLFRKLGYTICGSRNAYYTDGADAFVLRKQLVA